MTKHMKNVLNTYCFISETVCYIRSLRRDLSLSRITSIINNAREFYRNGLNDEDVIKSIQILSLMEGEWKLNEDLLKLLVEDGKWLFEKEQNPEIPCREIRFYPGLYYLVEAPESIPGSEYLTGGSPLDSYTTFGVISGIDGDRFIKNDPYLANHKVRITPLYTTKGGWSCWPE